MCITPPPFLLFFSLRIMLYKRLFVLIYPNKLGYSYSKIFFKMNSLSTMSIFVVIMLFVIGPIQSNYFSLNLLDNILFFQWWLQKIVVRMKKVLNVKCLFYVNHHATNHIGLHVHYLHVLKDVIAKMVLYELLIQIRHVLERINVMVSIHSYPKIHV
jgi:hypothetical protein